MNRETIFSKDKERIYRYTLWRDWSAQLTNGAFFTPDPHLDFYPGKRETFVQFIGLNPSVADEVIDDNTIRRCIVFAQTWGFGALCMTNLFAFRSTKPSVMKEHEAPVGPENDGWIKAVADAAGMIVCCWGKHGNHLQRGNEIEAILRQRGKKLFYFRMLCDGLTPEHPLYMPKNIAPTEWTA